MDCEFGLRCEVLGLCRSSFKVFVCELFHPFCHLVCRPTERHACHFSLKACARAIRDRSENSINAPHTYSRSHARHVFGLVGIGFSMFGSPGRVFDGSLFPRAPAPTAFLFYGPIFQNYAERQLFLVECVAWYSLVPAAQPGSLTKYSRERQTETFSFEASSLPFPHFEIPATIFRTPSKVSTATDA